MCCSNCDQWSGHNLRLKLFDSEPAECSQKDDAENVEANFEEKKIIKTRPSPKVPGA